MSFSKIATSLALFATSAQATYTIQHDYTKGSSFWNHWDFETQTDATHGTVQYVDQATAASQNMGRDPLISRNANGSYYMGADHNTTTSSGRPSVRIQSKASFNSGLFILDLSHMPGGECGSWPAFWLLGYSKTGDKSDWPASGEVDILEGVNNQVGNDMTLHTSPGCKLRNNGEFTAKFQQGKMDCGAGGGQEGCQISDEQGSASFGSGFNAIGGGIYATEWLHNGFAIWFFPRTDEQRIKQATSQHPDPSQWGKPLSKFTFQPGCSIDSHFTNMKMIFDLTFCGDWAGATNQPNFGWLLNNCNSKGSCSDHVNSNPHAFKDAFWTINFLRVYQSGMNGTNSSSPSGGGSTGGEASASPLMASSAAQPTVLPPSSTTYTTTFVTVSAPVSSDVLPPSPTTYTTTFVTVTADTTTSAAAQYSGDQGSQTQPSAVWTENSDGAVQAPATKKARHLDVHKRHLPGHAHY